MAYLIGFIGFFGMLWGMFWDDNIAVVFGIVIMLGVVVKEVIKDYGR